MRIDVTQEDIDKGDRCSGGISAIALAARRAGLDGALDDCFRISWKFGIKRLPYAARAFAWDYLQSRPVAPFSFELEV